MLPGRSRLNPHNLRTVRRTGFMGWICTTVRTTLVHMNVGRSCTTSQRQVWNCSRSWSVVNVNQPINSCKIIPAFSLLRSRSCFTFFRGRTPPPTLVNSASCGWTFDPARRIMHADRYVCCKKIICQTLLVDFSNANSIRPAPTPLVYCPYVHVDRINLNRPPTPSPGFWLAVDRPHRKRKLYHGRITPAHILRRRSPPSHLASGAHRHTPVRVIIFRVKKQIHRVTSSTQSRYAIASKRQATTTSRR